jgi:hypothetical protein
VVRKTLPSSVSTKPTLGFGNAKDSIALTHPMSDAVHGRRVKVAPPSSERRSAHPPPTITVSGLIARTRVSSPVKPVRSPIQVPPPSSVRKRVPNPPTA